MNQVVKLGLFYAALSILISLTISLINPELLFSGTSSLVLMAVSILMLILGGRYFLRSSDQDLPYGTAVKYLFIASLIGTVCILIYTTIAYGNNENMETMYRDYSIRSAEKGIELSINLVGGSEADLQQAKDEYHEKLENGEVSIPSYPYSLSALPLTFLMSAFIGLIYSLIAAIFVKKKG